MYLICILGSWWLLLLLFVCVCEGEGVMAGLCCDCSGGGGV